MNRCPELPACNLIAHRYEDASDVANTRLGLAIPQTLEGLDEEPAKKTIEFDNKTYSMLAMLQGPAADSMIVELMQRNGGCEGCPIRPICSDIQNDRDFLTLND